MIVSTTLLRILAPRLIGFPLFKYLEPVAALLQKNAYRLRYLAWFNSEGIKQRLVSTPQPFGHDNRFLLYQEVEKKYELARAPLTYLEFGVATGTTIKWWTKRNTHPDSRFVGFDTFTGLPEDWGNVPKGEFSTGGSIPDVKDARCRFVKGMFHKTLAAELSTFDFVTKRTVVHIDADLYSSTLFVLMTIDTHFKAGDLIVFDEFGYVNDEFRACLDFQTATGRQLKPIAAVNCGDVIVFEVTQGA